MIYENKDWNITAGMNINFNKGKVDKLAENVTGLYGSSWCGSSSFPGEDYILQEGKPGAWSEVLYMTAFIPQMILIM